MTKTTKAKKAAVLAIILAISGAAGLAIGARTFDAGAQEGCVAALADLTEGRVPLRVIGDYCVKVLAN